MFLPLQASRFWAAGSDSDEEDKTSSEEEEVSEEESSSDDEGQDQKKGPSKCAPGWGSQLATCHTGFRSRLCASKQHFQLVQPSQCDRLRHAHNGSSECMQQMRLAHAGPAHHVDFP